ncbi:diguanylate cyclase [Rhizobiales bacterium RZME27]|uniref:diguanylate cyclase n=1 Tax=Endobacterium cereale TaxID=2663029 RepID=A0A6A8ABR5_9HYPH|nr:GGDEF domain-containing protein [Endobacterium cereale]MEB2845638.1 GGDEF domain-containing protein [Endobacterium cereale]MQY48735.1 diguanylate cyclase [Endobacterium cereale]
MLSALITSSSLAIASLLIGFALFVAWWQFGRRIHALIWAFSFMAATIGHGARIIGGPLSGHNDLLAMLACHASVASFAFLAWGFGLRAGRDNRLTFAFWGVATLALLLCYFMIGGAEGRMLNRIITAGADAAMVAIIVATIKAASRRALMLRFLFVGYGAYICSVAATAWLARDGGMIGGPVFFAVLSIGTPTGMIATGLLTLLIVAADLAEELRRQAIADPLTGLLNRRGLEQQVAPIFASSRAVRRPLVVVLADIDHFKSINDQLGHAAGDAVIRAFAAHLHSIGRKGDLVARIGGEEFALVLPGREVHEAVALVESLREGVPAALRGIASADRITASFGIALVSDGETFEVTLGRADTALYRSKKGGRNAVTLEPPPELARAV